MTLRSRRTVFKQCVMNVLIIDDEENIRKTTAMALESMGHEVTTADRGGAALKMLEGAKFDASVLDLKLREEMELICCRKC